MLSVTPRPGDRYLLCTDGVSEQVGYDDPRTPLCLDTAQSIVAGRLAACEQAGGKDNASAIAIGVN